MCTAAWAARWFELQRRLNRARSLALAAARKHHAVDNASSAVMLALQLVLGCRVRNRVALCCEGHVSAITQGVICWKPPSGWFVGLRSTERPMPTEQRVGPWHICCLLLSRALTRGAMQKLFGQVHIARQAALYVARTPEAQTAWRYSKVLSSRSVSNVERAHGCRSVRRAFHGRDYFGPPVCSVTPADPHVTAAMAQIQKSLDSRRP